MDFSIIPGNSPGGGVLYAEGMDPQQTAQLQRWLGQFGPALLLYARQRLDPAAAQDAVQEVFVRVWQQRHPPRDVKAWLFHAMRNLIIDARRTESRRLRREQMVAESRASWFVLELDAGLAAEEVQQAVQRLPESQRELLVLRIWGDLTFAEIAAITGRPISSLHDDYRAVLSAVREKLVNPCEKKM